MREAEPAHEGLHLRPVGPAERAHRGLRHDWPEPGLPVDKAFEARGRAGEEQIVQGQPVEEIRVTQMEAEIVPFEDPAAAQIDVVLLSADATLLAPAALEGRSVEQPVFLFRPSAEGLSLALLQAADVFGGLPARRR